MASASVEVDSKDLPAMAEVGARSTLGSDLAGGGGAVRSDDSAAEKVVLQDQQERRWEGLDFRFVTRSWTQCQGDDDETVKRLAEENAALKRDYNRSEGQFLQLKNQYETVQNNYRTVELEKQQLAKKNRVQESYVNTLEFQLQSKHKPLLEKITDEQALACPTDNPVQCAGEKPGGASSQRVRDLHSQLMKVTKENEEKEIRIKKLQLQKGEAERKLEILQNDPERTYNVEQSSSHRYNTTNMETQNSKSCTIL